MRFAYSIHLPLIGYDLRIHLGFGECMISRVALLYLWETFLRIVVFRFVYRGFSGRIRDSIDVDWFCGLSETSWTSFYRFLLTSEGTWE